MQMFPSADINFVVENKTTTKQHMVLNCWCEASVYICHETDSHSLNIAD